MQVLIETICLKSWLKANDVDTQSRAFNLTIHIRNSFFVDCLRQQVSPSGPLMIGSSPITLAIDIANLQSYIFTCSDLSSQSQDSLRINNYAVYGDWGVL